MVKDPNRLLLSIVIANYNYGRFLAEAIQSVLSQKVEKVGGGGQRLVNSSDVELIIIDGDSDDNSVEVIQKYAGGLPPGIERMNFNSDLDHDSSTSTLDFNSKIAYWISEQDKGQSDAFNKGFAHAHGRFLTWLNADDVMLPGTIEKFKIAAEKHPDCEWFVGGVLWLTKDMRVIRCGRGRRMSRVLAQHGIVNVCGPSSFFSKRLYESVGRIDIRHHYSMDTDLWMQFALCQHQTFIPFARYAWGLRLHEDAKMSGQNFDEKGKLREGAFSFRLLKNDEKRIRQLDEEWRMTCEKLPPLRRKMGKLKARLVAFPFAALMSRFDTIRFKGKNYMEVIGGGR